MPAPIFRGIPEPSGFGNLSKLDQVLYLQALWDRIADGALDMPVPPSHLALAEQRLEAHRAAPERAQPALGIIDRLTSRKK